MSRTSIIFLTLFLGVQTICSAAAQAPRTINGVFDYSKSRQVVTNINRIRQSSGLKPLKMDAALTEAAMLRAAELAFREEEAEPGEIYAAYGSRPNGDGNLKLIGEQRHTSQPNVNFFYLGLSHKMFTDIGEVVKSLKSKSNGSVAFSSTAMHSIGCGSFISPQGFYYWVLFMMPENGSDASIPVGQWSTEVCIGTHSGEQTKTLSRRKSDENLTPSSFEVTGCFNYNKAIEVVELTNKERAAKGLKPYIMDSTLMELAMIRAIEMKSINNMTHTRPNGESGPYIIWDTWGLIRSSSENIAYGYSTAEGVVEGWMNSPGHREGILDKDCNKMGAGECEGYWVQLFAKYDKPSPVMAKSAKHIDDVTVKVAVSENGVSKVVKRKRVN